MNNKNKFFNLRNGAAVLCAVSLFTVGACKKDPKDPKDPHDGDDHESITTVDLKFKEVESGVTFTARWNDPDGPGGNSPVVDSILLDVGKSYDLEIRFLDLSGDHAHDLTNDLRTDADEHTLCVDFYLESNLTVEKIEVEARDAELNAKFRWNVLMADRGECGVTLMHHPDLSKTGSCDQGETDVDVKFPIRFRP